MNGADRIAAERQRQIEVEGYAPEEDTKYRAGQLGGAAAVYAMPVAFREAVSADGRPFWDVIWPWSNAAYKPTPENRIRELEKAGALIAAEIDRLLATEIPESEGQSK